MKSQEVSNVPPIISVFETVCVYVCAFASECVQMLKQRAILCIFDVSQTISSAHATSI